MPLDAQDAAQAEPGGAAQAEPGGAAQAETSNAAQAEPSDADAAQPDETGAQPDINAISKEQAVEMLKANEYFAFYENEVWGHYKYIGNDNRVLAPMPDGRYSVGVANTSVVDVRYVPSSDPFTDPSWYILLDYSGVHSRISEPREIPEGTTFESYLAEIEAANDDIFYITEENMDAFLATYGENTVIPATHLVSARYELVEVNAFTGEVTWTSHAVYPNEGEELFYSDDVREQMRALFPGWGGLYN
jgi:hypothetical protein